MLSQLTNTPWSNFISVMFLICFNFVCVCFFFPADIMQIAVQKLNLKFPVILEQLFSALPQISGFNTCSNFNSVIRVLNTVVLPAAQESS